MCAGKAEYTSAAIKRAAVHVWIAAKAAIITIVFILELHHANGRFGSLADIMVEELQPDFACLIGYFRKEPFLLYQADSNLGFVQIHNDIELIKWQTRHLITLRLRYQQLAQLFGCFCYLQILFDEWVTVKIHLRCQLAETGP